MRRIIAFQILGEHEEDTQKGNGEDPDIIIGRSYAVGWRTWWG